uniref:Uncharacterized protein n=1 Tax=Eutreptiella gymnastica TaxID=73025 RepID=A0A7S4LFE9_9EUGL
MRSLGSGAAWTSGRGSMEIGFHVPAHLHAEVADRDQAIQRDHSTGAGRLQQCSYNVQVHGTGAQTQRGPKRDPPEGVVFADVRVRPGGDKEGQEHRRQWEFQEWKGHAQSKRRQAKENRGHATWVW